MTHGTGFVIIIMNQTNLHILLMFIYYIQHTSHTYTNCFSIWITKIPAFQKNKKILNTSTTKQPNNNQKMEFKWKSMNNINSYNFLSPAPY